MAVGELAVNVVARTRKAINNLGKFRNEAKSVKKPVDSMGVSVKGFERKVREWPVPVNAASTSVDNLGKRSKKTGRELGHLSKKSNLVSKSMRRIGVAAVGVFAANVTTRKYRSIVNDLDRIAKVGAKLNIATENLIGLRHAANQTGVESDKLDMSLQRMTRRVAEAAQGLGEAQGALKELRLDAKKLNTLAPDQQFSRIADAVKEIKNPTDQVRIAFKLFDSEGVDLVNTLRLGSRGLRIFKNDASRLGILFSKTELNKVEKFNDAFERLGKLAGSVGQRIVIDMAPGLERVVNVLAEALEGSRFRKGEPSPFNMTAAENRNRPFKLGFNHLSDEEFNNLPATKWFEKNWFNGNQGGLLTFEEQAASDARIKKDITRGKRDPVGLIFTDLEKSARHHAKRMQMHTDKLFGKLGAKVNGLDDTYASMRKQFLGNALKGNNLFGQPNRLVRGPRPNPAASKVIGNASRMLSGFLGRNNISDLIGRAPEIASNIPNLNDITGFLGNAVNSLPQSRGPMGHQGINRAVDANTIEGYMALRANTRGGSPDKQLLKANQDGNRILDQINKGIGELGKAIGREFTLPVS